jgi:hypothetical protein
VADQALRHPGLILGVARFFHDPRGSMRGVLVSNPNEGRLLAYALIAAAILLFGRILGLFVDPSAVTDDIGAHVTAETVSMLFFVPIFYYGIAALGTMLARMFGGKGTWRDGRAAFFWAALVSAPVVVVCAMAGSMLGPDAKPAIAVIAQLGQVFFAWALAQCFAEAFGFDRAWLVFVVIGAICLVILALLWHAKL